jgi:hypothetical protein
MPSSLEEEVDEGEEEVFPRSIVQMEKKMLPHIWLSKKSITNL